MLVLQNLKYREDLTHLGRDNFQCDNSMEVTSEGTFSPPISPLYDDKGQLSPSSVGSGGGFGNDAYGGGNSGRILVTSSGQILGDAALQVSNGTILELTNETFGNLTGGLLPTSENGGQSPSSQIKNGHLSPKPFGHQSMSNRSNSMSGKAKSGGKSPTCRVCGDESSGFHYGVDSCEGCKGFFRRCITQGMTHKCSNEEKCEITPFTRNSCQYCRLKKCFAVGMSREASRLGRRPKRLKDSSGEPKQPSINLPIAPYPSPAELYKLRMAELQRLLQQNGTFKSELMQAFLSAAQVSFREHQRHGNDNQKNNKTGTTSESGYSSSINSPTSSSKSHSPASDASTQQFNNNQNQNVDSKDRINEDLPDNFRMAQEANLMSQDNRPNNTNQFEYPQIKKEPDFDTLSCSASPVMSPSTISGGASPLILPDNMMGQFSPSSLTPEMMKMMMSPDMSFMDNGNDGDFPEPDPNANIVDIERVMEEVRQVPSEQRIHLMEEVFSKVSEAHLQTCHCTYQSVALANERHEKQKLSGELPDMSKLSINPSTLWHMFVQNMLPEITQVVKFCKRLPGFSEICQDDQIILIKKGSFETLACRMLMMVDTEKNEMFTPDMKMKCDRVLIKEMPMGTFLEELFALGELFNPLLLQETEIGLFTCVLLLCPDRPGLTNKKAVEKLNNLFSQSLYVAMKQSHPEDHDQRFIRLYSLIPVFRRINNQHALALNNLKLQKPEVVQTLPELHKEVYDLSE